MMNTKEVVWKGHNYMLMWTGYNWEGKYNNLIMLSFNDFDDAQKLANKYLRETGQV